VGFDKNQTVVLETAGANDLAVVNNATGPERGTLWILFAPSI
jgi:hypothetical protein